MVGKRQKVAFILLDVIVLAATLVLAVVFVHLSTIIEETKPLPTNASVSGGLSPTIISEVKMNTTAVSATKPVAIEGGKEAFVLVYEMQFLAGACLALCISAVVAYKLKDYLGFIRPYSVIKEKVTQHISSLNNQGQRLSLRTMVDALLISRKESLEFIQAIQRGSLDQPAIFSRPDEYTEALLTMRQKLITASIEEKRLLWINESMANLEGILKNESGETLYHKAISFLSSNSSSVVGCLYAFQQNGDDTPYFKPVASYGYKPVKDMPNVYAGAGQLGQIAYSKQILQVSNVPPNYLCAVSGLGSSSPVCITIVPLLFNGNIYGAMELGSFQSIDAHVLQWLERAGESLAAFIFNKMVTEDAKKQLEVLTNKQAEELVQIHALQRETNLKLEMKLAEAEQERLKNEAILEGCVDGVISFDEEGRIEFCNPVMQEMLEETAEEIKRRPIQTVLPIDVMTVGGRVRPHYKSSVGSKEVGVRTEATFTTHAGNSVDVLITATQVSVNKKTLFTLFIQKISADLF